MLDRFFAWLTWVWPPVAALDRLEVAARQHRVAQTRSISAADAVSAAARTSRDIADQTHDEAEARAQWSARQNTHTREVRDLAAATLRRLER